MVFICSLYTEYLHTSSAFDFVLWYKNPVSHQQAQKWAPPDGNLNYRTPVSENKAATVVYIHVGEANVKENVTILLSRNESNDKQDFTTRKGTHKVLNIKAVSIHNIHVGRARVITRKSVALFAALARTLLVTKSQFG